MRVDTIGELQVSSLTYYTPHRHVHSVFGLEFAMDGRWSVSPSGPPVSAFWVLEHGCGNKTQVIVLARQGLCQLSYLVLVFLTVSLPFCKICKVFSDI